MLIPLNCSWEDGRLFLITSKNTLKQINKRQQLIAADQGSKFRDPRPWNNHLNIEELPPLNVENHPHPVCFKTCCSNSRTA